jgi:hypothetical protein
MLSPFGDGMVRALRVRGLCDGRFRLDLHVCMSWRDASVDAGRALCPIFEWHALCGIVCVGWTPFRVLSGNGLGPRGFFSCWFMFTTGNVSVRAVAALIFGLGQVIPLAGNDRGHCLVVAWFTGSTRLCWRHVESETAVLGDDMIIMRAGARETRVSVLLFWLWAHLGGRFGATVLGVSIVPFHTLHVRLSYFILSVARQSEMQY